MPEANGAGIPIAPTAELTGIATTSTLVVPALLQSAGTGSDHSFPSVPPQEPISSSPPQPSALALVTAGNPAEVKVCDSESDNSRNMLIVF